MRKVVAIVAGVMAVLSVLVQPAAAANPTNRGTGTLQVTNEVYTPIGTVGGNTYYFFTETDVCTGIVTGSESTAGTFVLHSDGSWKGTSASVCNACSVAGQTGGFAVTTEIGGPSFTSWSGKEISVSSSGGLRGLDLTMNLVGGPTNSVPYTASYHFDR